MSGPFDPVGDTPAGDTPTVPTAVQQPMAVGAEAGGGPGGLRQELVNQLAGVRVPNFQAPAAMCSRGDQRAVPVHGDGPAIVVRLQVNGLVGAVTAPDVSPVEVGRCQYLAVRATGKIRVD